MDLPKACSSILNQLAGVIRQVDEKDFSSPSLALSNSTIGKHIRHTLEFFICLQEGIDRGVVNYENRSHDKLIESDKFLALDLAERMAKFVGQHKMNRPLLLETEYEMDDMAEHTIETNYFRELNYNLDHAVHHMAVVKIGLREVAPYVEIPPDFGIASSTLRYEETLLVAR